MKTFLLTLLLASTSVFAHDTLIFKKDVEKGRQAVTKYFNAGDPPLSLEVELRELITNGETNELEAIDYSVVLEEETFECSYTYRWDKKTNEIEERDGDCDFLPEREDSIEQKQIEEGRKAVLEELKSYDSQAKLIIDYEEVFQNSKGEILEITYSVEMEGVDYECSYSYLWDVQAKRVQELDGDCDSL